MKVLVLGSGVIGVSIAHRLAVDGHAVTVVDRQPAAGLETSYANAGEVSPGYSAPWAGPGVPLKAIHWLAMQHRPLVIRPNIDLALVRWAIAMLRNCTTARYEVNKSRMVRLAEYSRDCLIALRAETGITYDERSRGTLQLFRTQKQLDGSAADIAVLRRSGVAFELLDRDGCIEHEPALGEVREKFLGGLRLPGDETGDCFKFTQRLAALAAARGVTFRHGVDVVGLQRRGGAIDGVTVAAASSEAASATSAAASVHRAGTGPAGMLPGVDEIITADAYVVALGSYSPPLLARVGIDIPVYPVKGYSLTVPIVDPAGAPESTVMDETHKIAVTRLGDRIRVGGTAELAGFTLKLHGARRETLAHVVNDLFPRGGDVSRAEFWCGLRPMTPDGTPVIGATPLAKLFLATGHGTLGWTMATGTARVLADVIGGRAADIDLEGLGLSRYARAFQ